MNCDPKFKPLLKDYSPERLQTSDDTIYGLWPDFRLAYFNQGWSNFARQNGGEPAISDHWSIGRHLLEAIPDILRPFFVRSYKTCLSENQPWEHEYECSSAEVSRTFLMRAYPLRGAQGILVVNSPIHEAPRTGEASLPEEHRYRITDGLINQCCHCRRIRRLGNKKAWDLVPQWIAKCPPNTSHGICEPCFGFYYGGSATE